MTGSRSRRRFIQMAGTGALTSALAGCSGPLFGDDASAWHRPTTGERVEALSGVDDAMKSYMLANDIPGGALGIAKDGEVVFERGYGHSDLLQTEPVRPDDTFRIASITKLFTKVAVKSLVDDGRLATSTRPFRELDLEPPAGESRTDGLNDVTVSHLLDHEGGWDITGLGYDPTFHQFTIAQELDVEPPATTRDIVRFMLSEPLQFEPGEKQVYSNFGYLVLSLLVEHVTSTSFPEFVRSVCFEEDVSDVLYEGSTRPANRPEREVDYHSVGQCPNAMTLEAYDTVPCADGGWPVASVGGAGELVTNVRTLLAVSDDYTIEGEPRGDTDSGLSFHGSAPGVYSVLHQRKDGVDVAVLFNYRGRTATGFADVQSRLGNAIGNVDDWP